MVDDLLADRSEQETPEAAEAAPTDNDHFSVGGLREEYIGRLSLDRHSFYLSFPSTVLVAASLAGLRAMILGAFPSSSVHSP